jgi:serine/threonine-protein kinase
LGNQYRIERELGRGGMGIVFLARDLTLDRLVAVKVLHPDLSTNRVLSSRFLAEARTIAKLRHPNIVSVHAAGEVEGQLFYVMDFLSGETLRQRLVRQGPLPVATAVRIATDIAAALDAASAAGIVHRDLKPENILLEGTEREPRALLADFGIARLIEGGAGHTGPGAVMGTPAYMSPEQAAGEPLDGRSDLYSLGIVSYEMLVGAPPFGGTHRAVISKHILDPVTPLETARRDVPAHVSAAVMRALDKVPDARWPSGAAYANALREPQPRAARPVRQRRWRTRAFLAAAAALMTIAVGTAISIFKSPGPPPGVDPRRSLLVLPFDNLRDEPSYEWLRDGSVSMLTLSLSQWRDLAVIDQDRVHDLIEKTGRHEGRIGLELARRLARAGRAWTVVLGDFTKAGDSLHLVARTYDVATGRQLDVVQAEGPASDDVRPLFDDLAAKLLDLTGAPKDARATVASVTTESVEAYRAFLRGNDALNHWRLADASRELMRAVEIDSTFTLANYKLAVVRGWIGVNDTLGQVAIRRAARMSERLPARERQLIEAYQTFSSGDLRRGADLYQDLIRRDSTDTDAWYGFADAKFHAGYAGMDVDQLTASLRGFRRVIALDSTYALAYEHIGAMLTDAGVATGRLVLAGPDSLAVRARSGTRSSGLERDSLATSRARREAINLAQAWTRFQPNTPRAHYHLYKAYLASNRPQEARQTLAQLRSLYPDSLQPFFGLLEARAHFVEGNIVGATRKIRSVLPQVRPPLFRQLDFAPEPLIDAMTGLDALGYYGDLQGAAQLIRLGRGLYEQRAEVGDSADRARWDEIWELSRMAQLQGAAGVQPEQLRSIWERGVGLSKNVLPNERPKVASYFAPAAVGLLLDPAGDVAPITQLEALSGRPNPPAVKALIALRRGDTAAARAWLARLDGAGADSATGWIESDQRPLVAEAHFELGDYAKVIEVLAAFRPESFTNRGFDPRWVILPRVRLLRGVALERLHRVDQAAAEYQAVIDQWSGADPELLPAVQRARQGLARLEGVPESHS